MLPYRSSHEERPAPLQETGLIGDMVRQFADPYAFLRELVQNSLDAGAHRVDVRVGRVADGVTSTAVLDDGQGMTRETIEGPLLTLFASSKEGVEGKIGKYGVGFISVLAIGPEAVEVETWRDGRAFRLVLRPDTTFELEDAGPREGSGTRVILLQRMDASAFTRHAALVGEALRRWCRHADRPITLSVVEGEGTARMERVEVPFAVTAAAFVTVTEGDLRVVVGPSAGARYLGAARRREPEAGAERFAGFYNRGLTLFETSEEVLPGLDGLRFKAMDPRFQHTLSRDDVRRDRTFREALRCAREASRGPLQRVLAAQLWPAAEAAAAGREVGAYMALVEAALTAPTRIDAAQIPFPLACTVRGRSIAADLTSWGSWRAPLLVTNEADALSTALAAAGTPVVRVVHPDLRPLLERCYPRRRVTTAQENHLLVIPETEAMGGADAALTGALGEALALAAHAVAAVHFCRVEGALAQRAALLLPPEGAQKGEAIPETSSAPRLSTANDVERRGVRFRSRDTLYLNVGASTVSLARAAAEVDPITTAALLARALILEARGPLGGGDADRLLDLSGLGSNERGARRRASTKERP
ncbi:ATP-binding protein [Chondromyces crocatus]|uniref:Uncharacterized protein n=1 Tax=Chondromyces crocatus TaxID=52 RepID=A0A0K1E7T4_CHOCO|nr:ATP-binding protein [Chondromyces crocatus]AKT36946.1 uncharacterized protein CMC5_010670 [Chondromyces crocatus]